MDELSDGYLEVKYIPFHTSHKLDPAEFKQFPVPKSTNESGILMIQGSVDIERPAQQIRTGCASNQQPHSTQPDNKPLQVR